MAPHSAETLSAQARAPRVSGRLYARTTRTAPRRWHCGRCGSVARACPKRTSRRGTNAPKDATPTSGDRHEHHRHRYRIRRLPHRRSLRRRQALRRNTRSRRTRQPARLGQGRGHRRHPAGPSTSSPRTSHPTATNSPTSARASSGASSTPSTLRSSASTAPSTASLPRCENSDAHRTEPRSRPGSSNASPSAHTTSATDATPSRSSATSPPRPTPPNRQAVAARHGSHTSHTGRLTSAAIDARDFIRARKDRETRANLPDGTLVAVAGGKEAEDATPSGPSSIASRTGTPT